jgi:hypothetical protein
LCGASCHTPYSRCHMGPTCQVPPSMGHPCRLLLKLVAARPPGHSRRHPDLTHRQSNAIIHVAWWSRLSPTPLRRSSSSHWPQRAKHCGHHFSRSSTPVPPFSVTGVKPPPADVPSFCYRAELKKSRCHRRIIHLSHRRRRTPTIRNHGCRPPR